MSLVTPEKIRTLQRKLYRKAKAEPRFPLLRALRQDLSRRYLAPRLRAGPWQRGCSGRGRDELWSDRGGGSGGLAGGFTRGTGLEDVPARSGAAGGDSQTGWGGRGRGRHSNDP